MPNRAALEQTRANLSQSQGWFRRSNPLDRLSGKANSSDQLAFQYRDHATLLRRGRIVWGTTIQANNILFRLDDQNAPGEVLCSTDPHFDRHPEELISLAHEVFELKGTQPSDPELRQVADQITGEIERSFGSSVPELLTKRHTRGGDVRRYSMIFDRRHLPDGVLTRSLFPVLCHPSCKAITMLPSRLWGPELTQYWTLTAEERAALEQEQLRREASRMSAPLVSVTHSALKALRQYAKDGGHSPITVQVGDKDGNHSFQFVDVKQVDQNDPRVIHDDVMLTIKSAHAKKLWGISIDYRRVGDQEGFSLQPYAGE